jgi:hypothetical protein
MVEIQIFIQARTNTEAGTPCDHHQPVTLIGLVLVNLQHKNTKFSRCIHGNCQCLLQVHRRSIYICMIQPEGQFHAVIILLVRFSQIALTVYGVNERWCQDILSLFKQDLFGICVRQRTKKTKRRMDGRAPINGRECNIGLQTSGQVDEAADGGQCMVAKVGEKMGMQMLIRVIIITKVERLID